MTVVLVSNPTTGYSWQIVEMDETVLVNEGLTYRSAHLEKPDIVGAGGEEVFTFRAVGAARPP